MQTTSEKTLLRQFNSEFRDNNMNSSHGLRPTSRFPAWMSLSISTKDRIVKTVTVTAVIVIALLFLSPFMVHVVQTVKPFSKDACFEAHPISHMCEDLSWSMVDNNKTCNEYVGTICKTFLNKWRNCTNTVSSFADDIKVYVQGSLTEQKTVEDKISELIENLGIIGSPTCTNVAIPFICQSAFPICNQPNRSVFQATKQECQYISMHACALEWQLAESQLVPLPACDTLPDQQYPINTTHILPENGSNLLSCNQQFYENHDGICVADCYTFKQASDQTSAVVRAFEIATGWFALCVCVIVFIISIKRFKAIMTFPTVFLVYMTGSIMAIALLVAITFFDQSGLYCNSRDLNYTLNNPTIFCTISGAIFHYFLISATLWWFFHVSFIFYMLIFPIKAQLTKKYDKYIHILLIALGVVLPLPGVIFTFAYSEYTIGEFPALLCVPKNGKLWYYSAILPLNVFIGVGVCMFPPMIWVIHKYQAKKNNGKIVISAAEKRIIFVLCFYALFGVSSLLYFGVTSWEENTFINYLMEYFKCESLGRNNCQHCYRRYTNPVLKIISFVMMSVIPVANLVFVINWKYIGATINRYKVFSRRNQMQDEHSILAPEID